MEEFFTILTNFGFPIALSCYLLLRFEKILDSLRTEISTLIVKNTNLEIEVRELKDILSRKRK